MALDKLPQEMLAKILRLLPPSERLDCALTCRRFADAVADSPSLDDVWLVIHGPKVKEILPAIIASRRQYRNLRIIAADPSGELLEIFNSLGRHLSRLEIIECRFEPDILFRFIGLCPKLTCFKLMNDLLREISEDLCRRLGYLKLFRCRFSDRAVEMLENRRALIYLYHRNQPDFNRYGFLIEMRCKW